LRVESKPVMVKVGLHKCIIKTHRW